MRILTVTHFFENHGGGIERVAGHVCRNFVNFGVEAVWAASGCDPASDSEIEVVPLACVDPIEKLTGLPMPIPGISAMAVLHRQVRKCDAVIVHDALYATSLLAVLFAKVHGKRVVLIQHIAAIPFRSRFLRWVMAFANFAVTRPMLRWADELVFISDSVRHDLLGTPPRRQSTLMFNGVDGQVFNPGDGQPPLPDRPISHAGFSGKKQILFVGRYVEKKGLTIMRSLAAARPELKFLLAGSGPIQPAKWGLPNVHDLGMQTPLALADLYRGTDALLLPSVGEGYPLVIQEAMACGLPVICGAPAHRADPDASAWVRGIEIELADPAGSARRCSQAIDDLMAAPVDRAAMARYASKAYDWAKMARGILELARGAGQ